MTKPKALALVRELAADSGNVVFTDHALRRMRKRMMTPKAVLECLRRGVIAEGPAQSQGHMGAGAGTDGSGAAASRRLRAGPAGAACRDNGL